MTYWVIGLSAAGAVLELLGIVIVSGRGRSIRATLRRIATRKPRRISRSLEAATEQDAAMAITQGDDAVMAEARYRLLEAELAVSQRELHLMSEHVADLEGQVSDIPDVVRRESVAPLVGVILLIVGLGCFVAANVVSVL